MSGKSLYPISSRLKSAFAVTISIAVPAIAICVSMSLLRSSGSEFDPDSLWSDVADFGDVIMQWQFWDYLSDRLN